VLALDRYIPSYLSLTMLHWKNPTSRSRLVFSSHTINQVTLNPNIDVSRPPFADASCML
jgi:hypothetical protein